MKRLEIDQKDAIVDGLMLFISEVITILLTPPTIVSNDTDGSRI